MFKNCFKKNSVRCFTKNKLRFDTNLVKSLKMAGLDLFPDEVKTWLFWTFSNGLLISYATNGLMFSTIIIVAKHFDVLKAEIESFGEQSTIDDIMNFVEKHHEALTLVEMLRKIYLSTFRFNFMQSLIILRCTVSQLLLSLSTLNFALFLVPVMFSSVQTVLNVYLSRKINNACTGISDGAYNCDWPSFEVNKMRNLILLIMLRSNNAKILKIIDFRELLHDSFSSVRKYFKEIKINNLGDQFSDHVSSFLHSSRPELKTTRQKLEAGHKKNTIVSVFLIFMLLFSNTNSKCRTNSKFSTLYHNEAKQSSP